MNAHRSLRVGCCSSAAAAAGLLAGWAVFPASPLIHSTPPWTALALCILPLAVWLLSDGDTRRRPAGLALAALAAVIGAAALVEYLTSLPLDIDLLLFPEAVRHFSQAPAGRPAPFAALALTLLAASLLAGPLRIRNFWIGEFLVLSASVVALLALLGMLAAYRPFYVDAHGKAISLLSTILSLAACLAALFSRPERPLASVLLDRGPAGMAARRLLPIPVAIPLVVGLARMEGVRLHLLDNYTAGWLAAVTNVVIMMTLIGLAAALLLHADRRRRQAEVQLQSERDQLDSRVRERTAELASVNHTLRTVIEASPLALVLLDRGGRVQSWNTAAEALFGWKQQEVLGRTPPAAGAEQQRVFAEFLERALRGERMAGWEYVHRRPDGSQVDAASWTAPLRGSSGAVEQILIITADNSERRRLEQQLLHAQRMEAVGRLAGGVAHDFNNLLTAILGLSEVVLNGLAPDHPLRAEVMEIRQAGERAAALTRQLLAFSRTQILQPQWIDLNHVIGNLEKMLRRVIGEDLELVTTQEPQLALVKADPGQVEQILMNLAVNARDAMPRGGRLALATANVTLEPPESGDLPPGRYVMLSVSDTGVGIADPVRAKIFEPFFTTKPQGTGLGLSTVYGIVRQSGGAILVDSQAGQGATFRVYLPAAAEGQRTDAAPPDAAGEAPRGAETILLVEDEDGVRRLARAVLERCGYSVLEAPNAPEALQVSAHYQGVIHLLLSDVVMPQMSGRELAEALTALRPETRVLFMSGHTEDHIIRHGVSSAALAFLQKPFTPGALASKVRQVLDGQAAHAG